MPRFPECLLTWQCLLPAIPQAADQVRLKHFFCSVLDEQSNECILEQQKHPSVLLHETQTKLTSSE